MMDSRICIVNRNSVVTIIFFKDKSSSRCCIGYYELKVEKSFEINVLFFYGKTVSS